jgi:hypothetical protein
MMDFYYRKLTASHNIYLCTVFPRVLCISLDQSAPCTNPILAYLIARGGHRHLQIGRMLDIDLIKEPPHALSPQMYVPKVWESVRPEGQEAIHS